MVDKTIVAANAIGLPFKGIGLTSILIGQLDS